ncbi:hypothetical protein BB558_000582 [Smittium angustum]|uniref:Uncharacterized protein n=1 Tax=Smittium angustum TaxID=133377 RepID=A0A2U1JE21_SMIAN|nr:hypothetical protein BB558_000582 [Smittium angustum]
MTTDRDPIILDGRKRNSFKKIDDPNELVSGASSGNRSTSETKKRAVRNLVKFVFFGVLSYHISSRYGVGEALRGDSVGNELNLTRWDLHVKTMSISMVFGSFMTFIGFLFGYGFFSSIFLLSLYAASAASAGNFVYSILEIVESKIRQKND